MYFVTPTLYYWFGSGLAAGPTNEFTLSQPGPIVYYLYTTVGKLSTDQYNYSALTKMGSSLSR